MYIKIDDSLREIAQKIVAEGKSTDEWAAIEVTNLLIEAARFAGQLQERSEPIKPDAASSLKVFSVRTDRRPRKSPRTTRK